MKPSRSASAWTARRSSEVAVPWDREPAPPPLETGKRTTVPTGAFAFVDQLARTVRRGSVLLIDYGERDGPAGGAHGYRDQRETRDLLTSPGTTDVTRGRGSRRGGPPCARARVRGPRAGGPVGGPGRARLRAVGRHDARDAGEAPTRGPEHRGRPRLADAEPGQPAGRPRWVGASVVDGAHHTRLAGTGLDPWVRADGPQVTTRPERQRSSSRNASHPSDAVRASPSTVAAAA